MVNLDLASSAYTLHNWVADRESTRLKAGWATAEICAVGNALNVGRVDDFHCALWKKKEVNAGRETVEYGLREDLHDIPAICRYIILYK